mmetsp:Transcript_45931/g.133070  ORF Transcript_45931/g.133070 Transcript_45931/m.133070 type:complete len:289 (+) Transcript_45931:709-1575(+)
MLLRPARHRQVARLEAVGRACRSKITHKFQSQGASFHLGHGLLVAQLHLRFVERGVRPARRRIVRPRDGHGDVVEDLRAVHFEEGVPERVEAKAVRALAHAKAAAVQGSTRGDAACDVREVAAATESLGVRNPPAVERRHTARQLLLHVQRVVRALKPADLYNPLRGFRVHVLDVAQRVAPVRGALAPGDAPGLLQKPHVLALVADLSDQELCCLRLPLAMLQRDGQHHLGLAREGARAVVEARLEPAGAQHGASRAPRPTASGQEPQREGRCGSGHHPAALLLIKWG